MADTLERPPTLPAPSATHLMCAHVCAGWRQSCVPLTCAVLHSRTQIAPKPSVSSPTLSSSKTGHPAASAAASSAASALLTDTSPRAVKAAEATLRLLLARSASSYKARETGIRRRGAGAVYGAKAYAGEHHRWR